MKIIWIFVAIMTASCTQKRDSNDANGGSAVGAPLPIQPIISSSDLAPRANLAQYNQTTLTTRINQENGFLNPTRTSSSNGSQTCAAFNNLTMTAEGLYLKIEGSTDISSCLGGGGSIFTGTATYRVAVGVSCSTGKNFSSYNGKKVGDYQSLVLDCPTGAIQKYLSNTILTVTGSMTNSGQTLPIKSVTYSADMTSGNAPCEREYKQNQIVVKDCVHTNIVAPDPTVQTSTQSQYTQITFQNTFGALKANLFDTGSASFVINDWRGTMTYSNQTANWKAVDKNSSQASGTLTPTTNLIESVEFLQLPWTL